MNKLKTYIIHYTKLIDRKSYLSSLFKTNEFDITFVEEFDKEALTKENIKQFYYPNKYLHDSKVDPLWDLNLHNFRYLTFPEASCAIKHVLAIKLISDQNEKYGLVLEDDVIPNKENILKNIKEIINSIPDDWDAIFLGEGCGMNFINQKIQNFEKISNNIYKAKHPATNCAEAYILNKKSAKMIYDSIIPFQLAFDWELAYQFFKLNMNIYWVVPPVFVQGSKNGTYKSELQK